MKELFTEKLQQQILTLYQLTCEPLVTFPSSTDFGDYTTNVAMAIAKQVKKSPAEIAQNIVSGLKQDPEFATKCDSITAQGGYINITLGTGPLWNSVEQSTVSLFSVSQPKRILVEYGQPNTHKLPHIGHLFSYIVGDSLARILDAVGNTVVKANYQGDIGPHVAKSLYGYIQLGQPKPQTLQEKVMLLQKCYQEGNLAYDSDPVAKETIDDINKKIYEKDPEITQIWQETKKWSLDFYLELETRLGIRQTYHYLESDMYEYGMKAVQENIGNVFQESKGAIVFPGEPYGLHTRVFITKKGTPTYEAKDMGLNVQKYEDWPYDLNIITTASEQNAYFQVIIKALELANPHLKGKIQHIGFGMVSLSTGKMSSRTGQIVNAVELLDATKARVQEILAEREGLSETQKNEISETVTLAAVKFAFLRQNILQNMKFDLEESVSFEGKSGPYILYSYARIMSILRSVEIPDATTKDVAELTDPSETQLLRWLYRYPEVIHQAAATMAPHTIAEYVYTTAQLFNTFYSQQQIKNEPNQQKQRVRKSLVQYTAQILKQGLHLLGIETVDTM